MRLIFILLAIGGFALELSAQIIEKAPDHNAILLRHQQQLSKDQALTLQRLTREQASPYRNTACQSLIMDPTVVQIGTSRQICVDTTCLDTLLATGFPTITCPATLGTVALEQGAVCFDYFSAESGPDTVCLRVCDVSNNCFNAIFPIRVTESLELPFFDDFSARGPFPDSRRWVDRNVFINHTFAADPPSVGVATFDGITARGTPYGGGFGEADFLTSAFINLEGYDAADQVILSFWLQRKGLGDKPEEMDDLQLEFRNDTGQWEVMNVFPGFGTGTRSDTVEAFVFNAFQINDTRFFYDGFQFRFRNRNGRAGMVDLWHLDYVKLEANASATRQFADIAFTRPPSGILRRYLSMPGPHFGGFEDEELADSIVVGFFSHFGTTEAIINSSARLKELVNEEAFTVFPLANGQENNFAPGERRTLIKPIPVRNSYVQSIKNLPQSDSLIFEMTYTLFKPGQSPLGLSNDTVRSRTILDNYFAYDDGTAESNIIAQNIGTEIAVKFKANIDDTLRAIQFHFPHVDRDITNQLFNLKVYLLELDEDPEYQAIFRKPYYADTRLDTLQGFTTYVLFDDFDSIPQPVAIPAGDFYISWQQASSTEIPVGLDKNNLNGARQAFFTTDNGESWQAFPTNIKGAIMMRPVLGNVTPEDTPTTSTSEVDQLSDWMQLYPNPARDRLYFRLKNGNYADYHVQLFNSMGQLVKAGEARAEWNISQIENGLYFLKIFHRELQQSLSHKLMILK